MHIFDLTREFQGHFAAVRGSTRYLVVHHAAAEYPPYFGRGDVAAIANYHLSRGWSGIGYHEVLAQETNNGPIAAYLVSRPDTVRAHIAGRNHECFGICMAANFSRSVPPQQWLDALALRLVAAKRRWPNAQIVGHRDITLPGHATSCPGDKWAAWKPMLLAQVENMLKQAGLPMPPPTKRYRARRVMISQRQAGGPPWAGELAPGEEVTVDKWYSNNYVHLADGRGFCRLADLEES